MHASHDDPLASFFPVDVVLPRMAYDWLLSDSAAMGRDFSEHVAEAVMEWHRAHGGGRNLAGASNG